MRRVFVDSGAFFALLVPQDASHAAAVEVFQRAEAERWELITTNVVVIETYALLLSRTRLGRQAAIAFLDDLERSAVRRRAHQPPRRGTGDRPSPFARRQDVFAL